MKLLARPFSYLVCLAAWSASASVVSTNPVAPPIQIVTCRDDVDTGALLKEFHIALKTPKHHYRALKGFAAPMDAAMIKRLKSDHRVLYVEADGPVAVCGQISTWFALRRIGIPQFPLAHINGTNETLNVDVAIIDSGIDPHEDLEIYNNDFYAFGEDASDAVGHGTLEAGVVAMKDNHLGYVGVAPGVRIWNVKVSGPPPDDGWSHVLSGMDYVLQNSNQISVANMSITSKGSAPIHSIR